MKRVIQFSSINFQNDKLFSETFRKIEGYITELSECSLVCSESRLLTQIFAEFSKKDNPVNKPSPFAVF